VNFEFIGTHFL